MFALLTTLNGTLSWVTRGLQASAKEGWLPASFATENKGGAPVKLLFIFGLVGALPIIIGMDTEAIATIGVGLDCLCEFWILLCVFQLPKKFPKEYEAAPFRFKTVGMHYAFLTMSCCIMLFTAYVNLSDLTLPAYIGVAIYMGIAYAFTQYRYKHVLALREANKV